MTAFGIPDAPALSNGLTLGPAERLEALEWSLSEAQSFGDINDIQSGAPFRSLTKFPGPNAERAARLLSARYHQIVAAYAAADANRRNREPALEGGGNRPPHGQGT